MKRSTQKSGDDTYDACLKFLYIEAKKEGVGHVASALEKARKQISNSKKKLKIKVHENEQ